MSNRDPATLSATELLHHYRHRQLSPVEVTQACLERIERWNGQVHAFCHVDGEAALATARESEARWAAGTPAGLLDGVPVTIKDLVLTQGWVARRGSLTTADHPPAAADAPATARLREAGAVLLGSTTTPEFGWKGVTDNPLGHVARNPWDVSRTSGGSSGGAGIAAALGMGALHIGTDVVVLAVGLFAVGEALYVAAYQSRLPETMEKLSGSLMMSREDWRRSWPAWLRATAIGFPFGTIPAGGAEIPTFLSYALEKKLSKHPEEFGNGAIEGVAGPEAANNASSAGVLVPLLTLGIPTSATAAILLAAFQNYGLQPGPLLFQTQGALVWGLIASMYIGNVLLLILNLPLIGLWVQVLKIPQPLLYAGILVFATLGAYSLHQSVVDLATLYVFGLLGFLMRRWGFPVAPAVIGLILGPLAESQFRRALAISQGDPSVFITHPISAALLAATVVLVLAPWLWKAVRERRRGTDRAPG